MNEVDDFIWVDKHVVLAVHNEQLSQHGGRVGVRDEGLLDSALARPKNLKAYENASLVQCCAAYAYGIIRNHPFNDGNKRTGFVVAITFLLLNNYYINVLESDVVIVITKLAAGELTEQELQDWIETIIVKAMILS
ncbi:MAG: type II toxin-antitoxin system death-on-curing family toxin [Bacteroidota bacterium]